MPAGREIHVKLVLEEQLFLSVRNTSNPVKIVNDCIPTTKADPALHGFGLATVKTILAQYGGEYAMGYENGWFQFAAEMKNTPRS
ncbi:MAG: GHKL domain-containing protein [Gemmiger sp.]|nr:GHKL domain-containing protein [Gemmiger sp.]